MPLTRIALLLSAALFAACDSKVTSSTNAALQKQIETITDCFPDLFAKGQDLLDLAETWRMNRGTSTSIDDPAGVSSTGTGPVTVDAPDVDGCAIQMVIHFYDPAGNEVFGLADTTSTVADKIDEAATELRDMFPAGTPFMVGDWTISAGPSKTTFSGSGSFTGLIGGSTNGNELEELRTTEPSSSVSGGPPAVAVGTITEGTCTLTFSTSGLVTDSFPTQEYPIGTVTVDIDGDDADSISDVTATLTFDNTAVVQIQISGTTSGKFLYNVETRVLTSVP